MELTLEHIEFIRQDLSSRGIILDEIRESLTDHLCCMMEKCESHDFETAYQEAVASFGEQGILQVEEQTVYLLIRKKQILMKRSMYVIGYIAAILSTSGLVFKLQHWPGAAIMLVLGIALFNFAFLPMYFYDRYKRAAG